MSHISRAYRWKFLLKPLGYNQASSTSLVQFWLIIYQPHPQSGDIFRVSVISAYEKIPFSNGLGTVIIDDLLTQVYLYC